MAKFEISIFNKQVRELVANDQHHEQYTDDWADFHYVEISADSEEQARNRINGRYPPENGFVVDSITRMEELE
ncbi:MAG: hypothetical protein HN377_09130 [Alphaproteobacteria bacterium]|jgi:hypothetical protein|nr:hypothetical protein [Alphaproteobacteria bacterium]MBT7941743.1 hypothetical protein [Alphaproteobacteria bacterium]